MKRDLHGKKTAAYQTTGNKPWLILYLSSTDSKTRPEQYTKYNEGIQAGLDKGSIAKVLLQLRHRIVQTTLWSCQPKQTRQDRENLQSQSTTKWNKPQRQTLSWTWTPQKYAWNFATISTGSPCHPGRHRRNVYANWSTTTRLMLSAIHV